MIGKFFRFFNVVAVVVLFLLKSVPVEGVSKTGAVPGSKKVPYRIPKVESKVRVDAFLEEDTWKKALVLELKYEVFPGENITPPVRTEVLLAYDDTYLYAAFRAFDPDPSAIRARFTDRDNFEGDDYVCINLDTFSDNRRYYSFYCNSLGIQMDSVSSLIEENMQWDGIWNSNGRITKDGYIVEMAIPFNTLRFQRKKGDQIWRFDAVRVYPRNLKHTIGFFPFDRNNMCYMCQADELIGFEGIKPGQNIEVDPTLSSLFTQERENFTEGKFIKKDEKIDPGITMKWGITPNMTLNATVNPDFSTVEADAAQLDINTQFALYYPEKRPFFLEGTGYFSTPLQVIYTRALADPNWGIKLNGKDRKHAIGFFSVQDNMTNLLFPGSQGSNSTSLDMNTIGTALRYRHDISKSSSLGVVVTDREGQNYFNRLLGIDGDLRITPKDQIWFQFLGSQTRYPEELVLNYNQPSEAFSGTALDLGYSHDARDLGWYFRYQQITPEFRADLGFIPQVDLKYIKGGVKYNWYRPPRHWFTTIYTGAFYQQQTDYSGSLIFKNLDLRLGYWGPLQSSLNLIARFGKRSFMGIEFDNNQYFLSIGLRPSGALRLGLNNSFGDQIDFANIRQGTRVSINPMIDMNLGRHLILQLDHIYERLNVADGHLYTANVSNIRLVYQFNKRTFLRTILQYVNYKYNTANYTSPINPESKQLFSQVLFSYKINPRTVLFLGYSDSYAGFQYIPLTQTERTFFLKIGYSFIL